MLVRNKWPLLLCASLATQLVACLHTSPRIDGRSEDSFQSSYQALSESLSPEQKLKMTLAVAIVVGNKECAKINEPSPGSPFLNEFFGGQTSLKACRKELDGLSYSDIMKAAYPDGSDETATKDT